MVRIHQIPDRLIRNELLHFGDDGERTLLVQWAFDYSDMIAELHGYAVMSSAPQIEHAIGNFLGLNRQSRYASCCARGSRRSLNINGCVRLYIRDGKDQHRKASLLLDNHRREFHAAEILVLAIPRFDKHV